MTAEVVELRPGQQYLVPEPETRWDRARERIDEVRHWLRSNTSMKSPVVIVRRSTLHRREVNAFELGRDCQRYMRH